MTGHSLEHTKPGFERKESSVDDRRLKVGQKNFFTPAEIGRGKTKSQKFRQKIFNLDTKPRKMNFYPEFES